MDRARSVGRARTAGLAAGLALALSVVLLHDVPRGEGRVGATVDVVAASTGELAVSPAGVVLAGRSLAPGRGADGSVDLLNQTGTSLRIRVHGLPSSLLMDDVLMLRVAAGGEPVFRGSLGAFRRWSDGSFVVGSGETRTLTLRAWLPGSVEDGYEGHIEQVSLEFSVEPEP